MDHEIFETLLNRVVSLSVALEGERQARIDAEHKASAQRLDVVDVYTLMSCMASARKIEAIKAYRTLTGASLVDAKNAVESVMDRERVA